MCALVYSTDEGKLCPNCQNAIKQCDCKQQKTVAKGDGVVRLQRQTKGRKGKGVTLITGIALPDKALKQLAKTLKQRCSTGGAVKDGVIEIQGDQRAQLQKLLQDQGYTVKISGG